MATLHRDGVELWYEEAGTGGPPLLLVHGFAGSHAHMAALFDHFRTTHRVVTVDRRGHGRSDAPEQDYTVAFLPGDDSDRKAAIVADMASTPQHVLASTLQQYLAYDIPAALAAVAAPILYVGSLFAQACDLDRFRELAPQLVVEHVSGAGHFLMVEVPDQVTGIIEPFLANLAAPARAR